jgi:hypothetical protein
MPDLKQLRQLKDDHAADLLALPNVTGVGLGTRQVGGEETDDLAVVVTVREKVPAGSLEREALVPERLSGSVGGTSVDLPTDVREVGELRPSAGGTAPYNAGRRPFQPGYSIGPDDTMGTGTTACGVVRDEGSSRVGYVLSNLHVLYSNVGRPMNRAIYQPGREDGGGPSDRIGQAKWLVPLKTGGAENYMDAALATIDDYGRFDPTHPFGRLKGHYPQLWGGWGIRKVGRTTGQTGGRIVVADYETTIDYSALGGGSTRFKHQILVWNPLSPLGGIALGGDSGSLYVTDDQNAAALLFASATQANGITAVATPIHFVLKAFSAQLWVGRGAAEEEFDTVDNPVAPPEDQRLYDDAELAEIGEQVAAQAVEAEEAAA